MNTNFTHPSIKRTRRCLTGYIGIPFILVDLILIAALITMFFNPPIILDYLVVIGLIAVVSLIVFFTMTFGRNADQLREDYSELDQITDSFLLYIKPVVYTWICVVTIVIAFMFFTTEPKFSEYFGIVIGGGAVGIILGFCVSGISMAISNIDSIVSLALLGSFGVRLFFYMSLAIVFFFAVLYYNFKILVMTIWHIFRMYWACK